MQAPLSTDLGANLGGVEAEELRRLQERPGCLPGLLKLFVLQRVYEWLQENFGFGRGCLGMGCGVIFFVVFVIFACSILGGTNWLRIW